MLDALRALFYAALKGLAVSFEKLLRFTYSALRKWVYRFANQGPEGLGDRPRSGRPPTGTGALEQHLNRLVDQDPLQHGSLHSQWSCRELATVLAQQTGVHLGRESIRCALKKRM